MAENGAATLINSASFVKTCALIGVGALFGYAISKGRFKEEERKAKLSNFTDLNKIEESKNVLKFLRDKLRQFPPIIDRKLTRLAEFARDEKSEIRVMQWNMLARALCVKDSYSRAPDVTYDWSNYRLYRTLEELIRHDCDIICMEETDAYEDIKPFLHKLGYTSVFCPKFFSPCLDQVQNYGPDGCTIFYKLSTFQIVNMSCEKIFTDSEINAQTFIIMCLRHKRTGKLITVVCLHLKAKAPNHEKRTKQIGAILRTIMTHLYAIDKDMHKHALIVCGDFNGEPFEQFYDLIIKTNELGLKDAYSVFPNAIKQPTTIKYRGEGGSLVRRAIDYVFFTEKNLSLTALLELPQNDLLINEQGLPNLAFSSDHLSLVCDFKLD